MSSSGSRNPNPSSTGPRPAVQSVLRRLRQPEHVGDNRCIPCTLLNFVVAAVLALLIAVVNPLAGITALAISVGVIYLRGYLIPYTPMLHSQQIFDRWLAGYGHGPGSQETTRPKPTPTVEPESVLREAGAVEPCETKADLCLQIDFKRELYTTITRLRMAEQDNLELLAEMGLDRNDIAIVTHGDAFAAFDGEQPLGQWTSRAALLADVAGAKVISKRYDGWAELPLLDRGAVLSALRLFLTECPACGGRVRFGRTSVESTFRDMDVVAVTCEACHSQLFVQSLEKLEM